MRTINTKQAIAVAAALVLIVLLYAAPNKHTSEGWEDMALDQKINEGIALVNGDNPMQGIGMLLEVLEEDSNNVKALLYLGGFSVQSGQYDKAVSRLEKVVELEPSVADAWFYLGIAYRALEQPDNALRSFEEFKTTSDDPELLEVAEKYITDLKNS